MKLILANRDYGPAVNGWGAHMTDEGAQLQEGLEAAGWHLAGAGYDDSCRDVPILLGRHHPEMVFVQDKRDWDPANAGAFRKDIGFKGLPILARHPEIFRLIVIKDAASMTAYHQQFVEEVDPDAVVVYYHEQSIEASAFWLTFSPLIRTYHSVDADLISRMDLGRPRRRALVSGALNQDVYPLRERVVRNASVVGCDILPHPGYSNRGNHTPAYLETVSGYRVSIATASKYGFALRKIIEAVAVGTTPVTDLPAYDLLPLIDHALVRISPTATFSEIRDAIDEAEENWNLEERLHLARLCWQVFDYRIIGRRLDALIEEKAACLK
jgi:hypothetical protein